MSLRRSILEHFVMPSGSSAPLARDGRGRRAGAPGRAVTRPTPGQPRDPDHADGTHEVPRAASAPCERGTPPAIGLLCRSADAQSLGAALGLALGARHRAPVVAVCVWTGETAAGVGWRAPARPAARRLAASLAGRGHDARAAGRLAIVRLAADAGEAAVQARRATAAAGSAPAVLALGGPRVAAFDELLAEQQLVVVATASGAEPALARLALAGLASATARACVCEVPSARPARSLAAAGLTLLPSARRALAVPAEALS